MIDLSQGELSCRSGPSGVEARPKGRLGGGEALGGEHDDERMPRDGILGIGQLPGQGQRRARHGVVKPMVEPGRASATLGSTVVLQREHQERWMVCRVTTGVMSAGMSSMMRVRDE